MKPKYTLAIMATLGVLAVIALVAGLLISADPSTVGSCK